SAFGNTSSRINSLDANERSGSSKTAIAGADTSAVPRAAAISTPASTNVIIRRAVQHRRGGPPSPARLRSTTTTGRLTRRCARGCATGGCPTEYGGSSAQPHSPVYYLAAHSLLRRKTWSHRNMARPKRFELLTPRFVVWCSIQLSYGRARGIARGS